MRRIALIALLVVAIPVGMAVTLGAKGDGGGSGYEVWAKFDNAAYVVPGEDVKVAGVKVGSVRSLDVTADKKALLVLQIDNAGFTPFHADAHCTVRPQSLIGEKYVECDPGSNRAPLLTSAKVPLDGKRKPADAKHLLPLGGTSSPVDIDLIGDINRLPYRQRLAIIVNEFGTALAGRGQQLNTAIHRANPALDQTDRVLAILAGENRTLANLVRDSDTVIAPLAAKRERVAHFVVAANNTAQATAERSGDIVRSFQRFPAFLRQLKPTLVDLGRLSDEMTPVLADLDRAAPDLGRFILELGPFSRASTPALVSLGHAADVGRPALLHSQPLLTKLALFARNANPVGRLLDSLTASLDKSGGLEEVMNYIFFQGTAINGFDGISHYLRAGLITNLCSSYATDPVSGCNANFTATKSIHGASAAQDKGLLKLAAALRGGSPVAGRGVPAPQSGPNPFITLQQLTNPKLAAQRRAGLARTRNGAASGASPAYGGQTAQGAALDYLLGNGP